MQNKRQVYQTDAGTIYHGHVLDVLKALPSQSVDCCVTSPPYWGLRDYDLEGQVWGGHPGCDHEWGDSIKIHKGGPPGNGLMLLGGRQVCNEHEKTKEIIAGKFCQLCGAWFGSFGLEPSPKLYVEHACMIFSEVRRVLRDEGTFWLNLGDSYAASRSYQVADNKHPAVGPSRHTARAKPPSGFKPKDLIGIPWLVAFALRGNGWYLRQDIIWHKPNPMPESVTDRCTKAHEYIFLLSKSQRYYYNHDAIKETTSPKRMQGSQKGYQRPNKSLQCVGPMARGKEGFNHQFSDPDRVCDDGLTRNKRSVWTVSTKPFSGAHFAVFPQDLITPCILAGCPEGGTVLDPFFGSGTTGLVAHKYGRKFIGIDLSEIYLSDIAIPRIKRETKQMRLFA